MFLASISFSLIDIIILCFILAFMIIGLFKGFIRIIFSFLKKLVILVITYFLTGPFTSLLCKTNLDESLSKKIGASLVKKAPSLNNVIDMGNYKNQIYDASREAGIPKFIGKIISKVVNISDGEGVTVGEAISSSIAHMICAVIAFVALFIILSISVYFLSKFFQYLVTLGGLRTLDRILGMILNGVYAVMIVALFFLLASALVSAIPPLTKFVNDVIYPNGLEDKSFGIAKWLYENNPLKFILENALD